MNSVELLQHLEVWKTILQETKNKSHEPHLSRLLQSELDFIHALKDGLDAGKLRLMEKVASVKTGNVIGIDFAEPGADKTVTMVVNEKSQKLSLVEALEYYCKIPRETARTITYKNISAPLKDMVYEALYQHAQSMCGKGEDRKKDSEWYANYHTDAVCAAITRDLGYE